VTNNLTAASRPVGCPPDLAPMSDQELEEHGTIIGRLQELAREAEEGNDEVVGEIRAILEGNPGLAWRLIDIGKTAERFLIKGMTADRDLVAQQIIEHQLESMRRELAGEDASPLERLLAERVVATWLQVQHLESLCAVSLNNLTLSQGGYYQRHLDRAHRNHLSAIRTLAQIRKLGPSVQINIADQQINTLG
jgi:hypothetical protein